MAECRVKKNEGATKEWKRVDPILQREINRGLGARVKSKRRTENDSENRRAKVKVKEGRFFG